MVKKKQRARISPEVRVSICEEYAAGVKQKDLAKKYGASQVRISQILREEGVKTRQRAQANKPTFDVDEAVSLYESGMSGEEVAKAVGRSPGAVISHLRRRGVTRARKERTYNVDDSFFSVIDPLRCYWAGFIAADGCVYKNRLVFGIHPDDRATLENFKKFSGSAHPIHERVRKSDGRSYVYLEITSKQWLKDLGDNFGIHSRKAKTIQPPILGSRANEWAFVRGYFDGDGHAQKNGDCLQITSGSKVFLSWVVRDVMRAHHAISPIGDSYGCSVTGPVFRAVVPRLYAGSTPETRMARKYDRLKHLTSG